MSTLENTGRLCSVYCPVCGKVTDKISFNLLREARRVTVRCSCGGETYLAHNGETVTVAHNDPVAEMEAARQEAFHRWFEKLSKEEQDSWLLTNGS
jgi:formylmethanofuran dehydrogenase subunit B